MIENTVRVHANGDKLWYLNGKLHREDGPAIEYESGDNFWSLNGKLHREEGPAIEYVNGDNEWYLNGELHREDGPAIENESGTKFWYLNGKELSEKKFNKKMNKPTELTMSQLNSLLGYDVKIVG